MKIAATLLASAASAAAFTSTSSGAKSSVALHETKVRKK